MAAHGWTMLYHSFRCSELQGENEASVKAVPLQKPCKGIADSFSLRESTHCHYRLAGAVEAPAADDWAADLKTLDRAIITLYNGVKTT